jgi:hypothetical protein
MSRTTWLTLAVLLFFTACMQSAVKGPGAETVPVMSAEDSLAQAQSERTLQVETFDPFSLPLDNLFYEPAETETLVAEETYLDQEQDGVGGFQVQLIATPRAELAEDLSMQAKMLFPSEPVILVFDPPNYKVRVGRPASREMAEELKRQALRLGYNEAWVVRHKAD